MWGTHDFPRRLGIYFGSFFVAVVIAMGILALVNWALGAKAYQFMLTPVTLFANVLPLYCVWRFRRSGRPHAHEHHKSKHPEKKYKKSDGSSDYSNRAKRTSKAHKGV